MASVLAHSSSHPQIPFPFPFPSKSKGKFTTRVSYQSNSGSHVPLPLTSISLVVSLQSPPAQVSIPPSNQDTKPPKDEFYVNLGLAVRTLREDLHLLFVKNLNYDIYREDITFSDPLNTITGKENYRLIFWALRFHGKILFREIALDVYRVWQPSENVILMRWNLRGVPRVPWEAKGEFGGTSRYKLDRNGKIYEHQVDNLAFHFPRPFKPVSVLDLITASPASPNLTFLWSPADSCSSPWLELYSAVRKTVERQGHSPAQDGLALC